MITSWRGYNLYDDTISDRREDIEYGIGINIKERIRGN
jgi:hypothetical protein